MAIQNKARKSAHAPDKTEKALGLAFCLNVSWVGIFGSTGTQVADRDSQFGGNGLPSDATDGHDLLVAREKRGSPAARAGIFTDDKLMEYDKLDARNWRGQTRVEFPLVDLIEPVGAEHSFFGAGKRPCMLRSNLTIF